MILYEAVLLSVVGAVVGIVGAVVLTRLLAKFPQASGYVSENVHPLVMVQGLVIALAVGLLGGAYPAIRGARLLPTEALRHE
jgi:putative ABC transport system permease protein